MNVACIIARTNSTRLEKKVLRPIGNKTAIEFLIDRIKLSKKVDKIYLCTSVDDNDKVLLEIAERNAISSFAGDRKSVISRMLQVGEMESADNLIRITGDNFLTDPVYLDIMLDKHEINQSEYTRTEYLPIGVTAEVMKRDMLIDCYKNMNEAFSEYLLLYAFNPVMYRCNVIIPPENHRLADYSLTVDSPEDYAKVLNIVNKLGSQFSFNDVSKMMNDPQKTASKERLQIKFPGDITIFYSTYRNEMNERIYLSNQVNVTIDEYLDYVKF